MIRDYVERDILSVHRDYLGEHLLADINTGARPFPDLERFNYCVFFTFQLEDDKCSCFY
jgi:hypothetical protein